MPSIATLFAALGSRPRLRNLHAGETLFLAGSRVKAVYVVSSGRLRLVRGSRNGGEVTLHRASAGESFAEPSLFSERYHCDALAEIASEVLEYSKAEILSALLSEPARMLDLLRDLAAQVQALRSRAEMLSLHAATDRLIAYLRLQMSADTDVLQLQSNWKQVASEIGLTHEALYRALRRLESAGVIERDGTTVRLLAQTRN